ncbi:2,3-diaminopropionate biosynthesis protein SbnA [Kitasatospora sp. NPDC017646]|uniref:2,3-diaminopropionate biosynthesis protein SbnA n=1 Tax=Kitasatospora sp. NPDC017646 TaxID=3364024 RepID=UPI00378B6EF7
MILDQVHDVGSGQVFLRLPGYLEHADTVLKLEGLNPAGSIKLKTAREMVSTALAAGELRSGGHLIESTSGNLGVALATICAAEGIRLTVVTDPNANSRSVQCIRALGADVVIVTERDANGGFLQTRIDDIKRRLLADPELVWLNQYSNAANAQAHRRTTAREITDEFGAPDWLFVGVGSSGTLMGCLDHFRTIGAATRIVAVDAAGSVTFGGPAGPRTIPGLGASRRPEIFRDAGDFEKCVVAEADTVRVCREVARRYGLLLGGSTGTALAALTAMRHRIAPRSRVVVVSPDLGERYLDTIYDDDWVALHFGPELLRAAGIAAAEFGGSAPEQLFTTGS